MGKREQESKKIEGKKIENTRGNKGKKKALEREKFSRATEESKRRGKGMGATEEGGEPLLATEKFLFCRERVRKREGEREMENALYLLLLFGSFFIFSSLKKIISY